LQLESSSKRGWQHDVYDILRAHDVTQISYVPDAGHAAMIDLSIADPDVHSIALTTEEEGVALAAGADLGDARAILLMQSSGVGNCINFLSLMKGGKFPLLTLVTMRGEFGEGNPWQMAMGQAVRPVLEAMGVICMEVTVEEEAASIVDAAATMAFKANNAVAVLLTQKLLGAKAF
jgi:sulfopyruvate decarboxylase alpha subunit